MFKHAPDTLIKAGRSFICDQSGATAIEYALVASGVAVAIAAVVFGLGTAVQGKFNFVSSSLK